MSELNLQHLKKVYDGGVVAVHDFNIDIKEGEFIVIVGPSGCGKSTSLRMIAGLEEITSGNLFIDGKYANVLPPKNRDISMVFQSYALYPHMSVYNNMAFAMQIRPYSIPKFNENSEPVMGIDEEKLHNLKKEFECFGCGRVIYTHEEKESDCCFNHICACCGCPLSRIIFPGRIQKSAAAGNRTHGKRCPRRGNRRRKR